MTFLFLYYFNSNPIEMFIYNILSKIQMQKKGSGKLKIDFTEKRQTIKITTKEQKVASLFLIIIFIMMPFVILEASEIIVINSVGYYYSNPYLIAVLLLSIIQPALLLFFFFCRARIIHKMYLLFLALSVTAYPIVVGYAMNIYFDWTQNYLEYGSIDPRNTIEIAAILILSSIATLIIALLIKLLTDAIPEAIPEIIYKENMDINPIIKNTIIVSMAIILITILIVLSYTYIAGTWLR